MVAYILTETDMELLKTIMEKWESDMRGRYSEGRNESGTPVGDTLGRVRYDLWGWIQRVKH